MNGFARASHDGAVVAAVQNGTLYGFDAQTGDTLWTAPVSEPTRLQGLDLSDDGSIVAVTLYDSCLVFEDGVRRDQFGIGASNCGTQYAAAISGDGSLIATGDYYGRCKLYRWSGSTYDLRWTASVGTPWCAGIAISRDGSTVAVGTGYNDGKLCVFDSSSATPLWVYAGYGSAGAYVPSIALSADGSRIAAASWGDRAPSGTFKVFTVHNRSDTTPLVGITRDDEPGSIFCCDISDDGTFAVCGGKAVHAQVMGSGGEVYAVIIGAGPALNVGVEAIAAPARHIQVGQNITPRATVRNYGDAAADFLTHLLITTMADSVIYHDSVAVTGLGAGQTETVSFAGWTPAYYNLYQCDFHTVLAGDEYPGDDTLVVNAKCFHDARPELIGPPNAENTVNMSLTPRITVRNSGSYSDAVPCGLIISDSAGAVVYSESTTTTTLGPEETAVISLAAFTPLDAEPYTATAWSALPEDFIPGNDTFLLDFRVTYEIIYDDGSWEAFYWVGRRDNDKFYVRFTPTLTAPLSLRHGRIYVNMANTPFDYVMVCKDNAGRPDTNSVIQIVTNVMAPVAPGWAEFDLDVTLATGDDVWLICHWPEGSPAIGVGADNNAPIDLRSYISSNQDTFRLWTTHDWMMRLTQSPEVGIEELTSGERRALRLHAPRPNPFSGRVSLNYEVPRAARVELRVFDAAGRQVACLADGLHQPGRYTANWRTETAHLTAGIYFAKLLVSDTGESRVRKLILAH
jgi:hypothetical protein